MSCCAAFPVVDKVESRLHDTNINNNFTAVSMASHFSGVLQLTDLDDFITPSQVGNFNLYNITLQNINFGRMR